MPVTGNDPLIACLLEIERHVDSAGWDQPARLFALVPTAELLAAEPSLAAHLGQHPAGALSSIEQDAQELRSMGGTDLLDCLDKITWPATVRGCALAIERVFLPAAREAELPDDPDAAADFVASHPDRQELRVVVGVTRDGASYGVGRLRRGGEVVGGPELVPALASALARTLD